MQYICFENRTFPGLFALGAVRSLAGARRAQGTLCHISHSIRPAVPLSLTLEEPPGWQCCETAYGSAGDQGDRFLPGMGIQGAAHPCRQDRRGFVGINSKYGHFSFIPSLFLNSAWVSPTGLPRLTFLHSLYYIVWLGHKVEGRWGQKEGKNGQNARHTQLLYTQAEGMWGSSAGAVQEHKQ